MSDYLKLAREAREVALEGTWTDDAGELSAATVALCDAIEAQAAEIERLNAIVKGNAESEEMWRKQAKLMRAEDRG